MPEDPFAAATETYSIVVAGVMNPAIHHPAWYKAIGALSELDLQSTAAIVHSEVAASGSALFSTGAVVCTPQLAQFTAHLIRVICLGPNWTISTIDRNLRSKILDVATVVFEALGHTPVTAYGLNSAFHRKTDAQNVATRLAEFVDSTSIAFPSQQGASRSATLQYTLASPSRSLNVTLAPSTLGTDMVFVSFNAHHPIILKDAAFQQFDLGVLLRESAEKDWEEAEKVLAQITRNFKHSGS